MKICYVVHQFLPDYFTGTEQYVHALARQMQGRGHQIEVFTLDPQFGDDCDPLAEQRLDVDGIPVTRVRFWLTLHRDRVRAEYQHALMGVRFGQFLDRVRPDAVHFFHLRYLGANLIDEARQRHLPTIAHLMDFWFVCANVILVTRDGQLCDGPPDGGMGCVRCVSAGVDDAVRQLDIAAAISDLENARNALWPARSTIPGQVASTLQRPAYLRRQLAKVDTVIAPSRFLKSVFADNGFAADRIEVLPYGVDSARLASAASRAAAAPLTLGFIGSLSPHKGLHLVIEATQRLRGDVTLEIWGRPEDFAEYTAPLRRATAGDDRIEFCGPFEPSRRGEVLARLSAVVVASQWYENTPFVVLEALAARRPVIATDLGGISEIVVDGENGELFRRGDVDDLTARLQRLIDQPERLQRYRAAIQPVHSVSDAADALIDRYGRLLAGIAR